MNLFEKLTAKAGKAAMDKAFGKGLLRCPNCGQKATKAPADAETILHCESCGMDSLPSELRPDPRNVPSAHQDQIPAGTRIRREGMGTGECVWQIPASGKFGFFLFFGLRTYQHGRVIKEQSFSRSSVNGARATDTGHMNGKPMKRIDLIVDGRARRIARWTPGEAADVWAGDVCRALGARPPIVRS